MKFTTFAYLLSTSIPVVVSYLNTYTGEVQVPKGIPQDCQTLLKIYDYFNLSRPGFITGEVMINCCYYESRRLHSMSPFATTEWECENDSQVADNHITSIILNGKKLSGEIPWDLLSSLRNLQILYLNNNQLNGDISNISRLSNSLQRINLSNNKLSGSLPSNIPLNLQLINVDSNENIKGPLPESWASRKNFQCVVPSNVCKPKSLSNYATLCNTTPNTTPISECPAEQMVTNPNPDSINTNTIANANNGNNNNSITNNNNIDGNSNGNPINNNVQSSENVINNINKSESFKNPKKELKSYAVLYMFLTIIGILAIIVALVACFAKYKNVKHERAMKESLLRNRMMLKKYSSEEDTFFKDNNTTRSIDEQFNLSKYAESAYTGSNIGSHIGSDIGNQSKMSDFGNRSKISNINTNIYEHAILMQNVDGIPQSSTPNDEENFEFDNNENGNSRLSISKTIDLSLTTDEEASYSLTTNPYTSSTYSEFYDSSYCSTCDTTRSTEQSSFSSENESSISLSCNYSHNSNNSHYISNSTSTVKNINTVDDLSSNITTNSSIDGYDDNKNYLTKRSTVSNVSGRTLINRNSSNVGTSASSVLSSGTVTTATTKFIEDDNMKMVLEDIVEEKSTELSKTNITIDLDDNSLGKGLNISYIFKDNSFFNDNQNQEDILTLNW